MATLTFLILVRLHWLLPSKIRVRLAPFFNALGRKLDGCGVQAYKEFDGFSMTLDLGEKTQRSIFTAKVYEEWISNFVSETLQPGDLFIDVGANVGYYSLLAHSKGARVQAYEPDAYNFSRIPIPAEQIAIGETEGTMTLHINPLNRGGNSLIPYSVYKTGTEYFSRKEIEDTFGAEALEQTVKVKPLDALISEPVKILKIDVEGFEASVFKGMTKTLEKGFVEYIICELGADRESLINLLNTYGYRIHLGSGRDLIFAR